MEIAAAYDQLLIGVRVMVVRKGLAEIGQEIADVAEEILHTAIVAAMEEAANYDPTRSAYAWLMGIAVHKIKDRVRKLSTEKEHAVIFADAADSGLDGAEEWENHQVEDRIDAALYRSSRRDQMTDPEPEIEELLSVVDEPDRKALTLRYIDGLDGLELAAALCIEVGAAYVRLARAREHLRQKYFTAQSIVRKDNL